MFYFIVLYASEDDLNEEDYFLNTSSKKLHRFIIPIKDITKPVILTYLVKDYSILFTVKHDEYEADFKYDDLLFLTPLI